MKKILSIDPSISHIGIAYLEDKKLLKSLTLKTNTADPILLRLKEISRYFRGLRKEFDHILIEMPDSFMRMGDYAVKNVGSIQLLMLSIGVITASLMDRGNIEFVGVREWKGQADKRIAQMIAEKESGKKLNSHEADAYVMALRWQTIIRFRKLVRQNA